MVFTFNILCVSMLKLSVFICSVSFEVLVVLASSGTERVLV
jgi:hypothetical protein